jgi:hypothetical protein
MHKYPATDILWEEYTICSTTLPAMRALLQPQFVKVHSCLIVNNAGKGNVASMSTSEMEAPVWNTEVLSDLKAVLEGITSNGPATRTANEEVETNVGLCKERKRKRNRLSEDQTGKAKKAATHPVTKQPWVLAHRSLLEHQHGSSLPYSNLLRWSWESAKDPVDTTPQYKINTSLRHPTRQAGRLLLY